MPFVHFARAFLAFLALETVHGHGFSLEESKRMMRYAYASYYPRPEEHGLPKGAEVKGTFKFRPYKGKD